MRFVESPSKSETEGVDPLHSNNSWQRITAVVFCTPRNAAKVALWTGHCGDCFSVLTTWWNVLKSDQSKHFTTTGKQAARRCSEALRNCWAGWTTAPVVLIYFNGIIVSSVYCCIANLWSFKIVPHNTFHGWADVVKRPQVAWIGNLEITMTAQRTEY